ncbi:hypothetical protein L0Y49_05035 [bacterium]|nr:hypothetical protein [bacterium]MCI0565840.1 hypothetical protein [bacterium]MCI0680299.1 hypothetical protein [bacterium]
MELEKIEVVEERIREDAIDFIVRIGDDFSNTYHFVTLEKAYFNTLERGRISERDFVKRIFLFLLRHESKEKILKKFNAKEIPTYFPEFEEEMTRHLR